MESRIAAALAARPKVPLADPALAPAAVVVPVFYLDAARDGLGAVFIRRSDKVETHKGQFAFPGGFAEAFDPSLEDTALREFEEELGMPRAEVKILGELDDIATIYSVRISPFVGLIPYPAEFQPNPDEVAAVVLLPLSRLVVPGVRSIEYYPRPDGSQVPVTFYRLDGHVIWGATGRILDEFLVRMEMLPSEELRRNPDV